MLEAVNGVLDAFDTNNQGVMIYHLTRVAVISEQLSMQLAADFMQSSSTSDNGYRSLTRYSEDSELEEY